MIVPGFFHAEWVAGQGSKDDVDDERTGDEQQAFALKGGKTGHGAQHTAAGQRRLTDLRRRSYAGVTLEVVSWVRPVSRAE